MLYASQQCAGRRGLCEDSRPASTDCASEQRMSVRSNTNSPALAESRRPPVVISTVTLCVDARHPYTPPTMHAAILLVSRRVEIACTCRVTATTTTTCTLRSPIADHSQTGFTARQYRTMHDIDIYRFCPSVCQTILCRNGPFGISIEILLDGDNLSDHLAISCACSVSVLSSTPPRHTSQPSCTPKLNWDKGDITAYHTVLSQSLSNIVLPTEALLCSGHKCTCHHSCLQRYYSEIINSLDIAAKQCISHAV